MFKFKKSYLLILLVIGVGIISISVYGTLAYNSMVEMQEDNYAVSLTGSSEVVTLGGNETKSVIYRVTNTNKGKVSYGVGYSVGDISVRVYSNYYEDVKGIFDYGESKYVKLYLKNNSANQSTVTLKTILGYEHGGDLIVPDGYALVTDRYASVGNGRYFNGTSDYIEVGFAGVDFGKSLTVGARFKPDSKAYQHIVGNFSSSGFGIQINNWQIWFQIHTAGMYQTITDSEPTIDTSKWYTVIGTYDGTTLTLYIDGKITGKPLAPFYKTNIKVSPAPILVGAIPNRANSDYNADANSYDYIAQSLFKGYISDVFVTKEVLDEETIAKNFTDTFIYDENDSTYFYYHLS